ncbi:type II toxin-antitoxin system VapC family toxin [Microbacterium thalassium]|uniref:Ribonuclease VapC n=1 Tax=Microbacterium thalassium TaxID=362649 RepID=A0A7X0FS65_9MICO|nr:type II toxin-antitoxin system VapC family toxin [Microbacterium thalassium]MBB6392735.1 putative nucleic acid-binding protein [Microbacterium thalassium]GLK23033.1 ribonuclease VapC [Microbacterium thalassium]
MIVVDASVLVDALAGSDRAAAVRARLAEEDLAVPDIADVEVASALRGLAHAGRLDDRRLERAVADLARMRLQRHPSSLLIGRALDLRASLTPYDAVYVALAEALDCPLLTFDARIAAAPGIRCTVEVPEE